MQLIDHIQQSGERLLPPRGDRLDGRHGDYVEGFQAERPPSPSRHDFRLPALDPALILSAADYLLRAEQFDTGSGADYGRRMLDGSFEQSFTGQEGWLAWVPRATRELRLSFAIHLEVGDGGAVTLFTTRPLPTWAEEFGRKLAAVLEKTPDEMVGLFGGGNGAAEPHDLLLGPGERLEGPSTGMLWDYSGCARADEVADLIEGELPLGRYAFGTPERGVQYGPDLFTGRYRTGGRMIYNGALICAPQNSGKTRLILRWALAANRAGMSVLVVDVKGNLRKELAGKLEGRTYYFSTDPDDDDSDGVNFLAGLDGHTPKSRIRVRQLVEALLPHEGWEAGEQAYFYQNHVNWLTGLIEILLLYRHYYPHHFVDGEVDLSVVFDMAGDERKLDRMMDYVRAKEQETPPVDRVAPGLDYWATEISLLIDARRGGQRTSEYSYRTLTQSITNALRPFSRFGTLYTKTSKGRVDQDPPAGARRFFSFEALNDPAGPTTIILAAREQDVDDATTVVSMVVKRLQHVLFDRMKDEDGRPVLLLLDETRRIRSFAPDEYITFARQARAGCVIVYQSLDQIGDDKKIRVILENVGMQVYLGSLVGETARHFIRMLPMRRRPAFSRTTSRSRGDASVATQVGDESVEYLTAAELYRLPSGRWPALVYINAQPRRNPILVDVDEAFDRNFSDHETS